MLGREGDGERARLEERLSQIEGQRDGRNKWQRHFQKRLRQKRENKMTDTGGQK